MAVYGVLEAAKSIIFMREEPSENTLGVTQRLAIETLSMSAILVAAQVIETTDLSKFRLDVVRTTSKWIEIAKKKYLSFRISSIISNNVSKWFTTLGTFIDKSDLLAKRSSDKNIESLAKVNFNQILSEYVNEGSILELGSGITHKNEISYLARMVGKKLRTRFIYSDKAFPFQIEQSRKVKTTPSYLQLDATNMDTLKSSSQSNVVALCVFDQIPRKDFPKIAEGLSRTLKPGGKVIIMSDNTFEKKSLIQKYEEKGKLLFPCSLSYGEKGLRAVSMDLLKANAQRMSDSFLSFLNILLKEESLRRFNYLSFVYKTDQSLSRILSSICPEDSYEIVDETISFSKDLFKAFVSPNAGFKVVSNAFKSHQAVFECPEGHVLSSSYNIVTADPRMEEMVQYVDDRNFGNTHIKIQSIIYTFVAEKI